MKFLNTATKEKGRKLMMTAAIANPFRMVSQCYRFCAQKDLQGGTMRRARAITGISQATTAADMRTAILESVALQITSLADLLYNFVSPDAVYVASGGALLHNKKWGQIIADALSREIFAEHEVREATSRGVAVLIASMLRGESGLPVETLSSALPTFAPNGRLREIYGSQLRKQKEAL